MLVLASAVPTIRGLLCDVILSVLLAPVSVAAVRSGVDGTPMVVSRVITRLALFEELLPAGSVAVTNMVLAPSLRSPAV